MRKGQKGGIGRIISRFRSHASERPSGRAVPGWLLGYAPVQMRIKLARVQMMSELKSQLSQ